MHSFQTHKTSVLFIVIIFCLAIVSCSKQEEKTLLQPTDYQTSLQETSDAILIDVRTPEEFGEGHLKGALNYNIYDSAFVSHVSSIDKNKPVYVYCKKGGRSSDAAEQLQALGYKHVYNLAGGYSAWEAQGFSVEK